MTFTPVALALRGSRDFFRRSKNISGLQINCGLGTSAVDFRTTIRSSHISSDQHERSFSTNSALLWNKSRFHDANKYISMRGANHLHMNTQVLSFSSSAMEIGVYDQSETDPTDFPKFSELSNLHTNTKRAIADLQLEKMTEIQSKTFEAASNGQDVLGRARTGTGKTLAFLLPTIEMLARNPDSDRNKIGAVIISPTRELATQIGEQAHALLKYHKNLSVQTMYGGVKKFLDERKLNKQIPSILVTTPGRLKDHLQTTSIRGIPFADIINKADQHQVLVLDETDRLLDMGFKEEINEILSFLPPKSQRQTLLFSATMPAQVKQVMRNTMSNDYLTVDCILDQDPSTHTNQQVDQYYVKLPGMDRFVSSVVETVYKAIQEDPQRHKIMVFFPTAMMVKYFSQLFNHEMNHQVFEIHAKRSQESRSRAAKSFKEMKRAIMFTTDVSARGVDYPDVTHVIQFGIPENRETYIHRLGRTGRAGKKGKGWLILAPFESKFLKELNDLDLKKDPELEEMFKSPLRPQIANILDPIISDSRDNDGELSSTASKAYTTMISFYSSKLLKLGKHVTKADIVQYANEFSFFAGLDEPPAININLIRKMGLIKVPGLAIRDDYNNNRKHSNSSFDSDGDNRYTGWAKGRTASESGWNNRRNYRNENHNKRNGRGKSSRGRR